jgi:hypothetical protein
MALELLTTGDFEEFKKQLLEELKELIAPLFRQLQPRVLKTGDVCKLLRASPGTVQNLRNNGTLPFKKIGGTIYYNYEDIERLLNRKK